MRPNEVQAFLQANEPELVQIGREVREAREQAHQVYKRIMGTLRNTHFKSKEQRNYAFREAQEFTMRLMKPFNGEQS